MKITELHLESPHLEELFEYYVGLLEMPGALHGNKLLIRSADTNLYFHKSEQERLYHFAFNIPVNRIEACRDWLKARCPLLPFEGEEIIHHQNWNSHAIYAFDAAKNIIEFITRPTMPESELDSFDPEVDVLSVSEIGMVVDSIPEVKVTTDAAGIARFSGADEYFSAFGTEEGLFITLDKQKDFWLPTDIKPEPFPFKARVLVDENQYEASYDSELTLNQI